MITASDPRHLYRYAGVATVLPSPEAIDEASVAAYHRDGYLAVAGLLSEAEVATAQEAVSDLIHGRVPGFEGLLPEPAHEASWAGLSRAEREPTVRKLWQFVDHEPRLGALTRHPVLRRILEQLLGEPSRLIQDMALLKPPLVGSEKPWHQDMAYFGWSPPEKVLGVWIALDPALRENGCMQVIPGSNRAGPVPHVHARDCQIDDARAEPERSVIVPLAPGGALFFASLLHHGTPPNESPLRRRALQYHYAADSTVRMDRHEHATLYFDGDLYAGCRGATGTPIRELSP